MLDSLFDQSVLNDLDLKSLGIQSFPKLSDNLVIRSLQLSDYGKGFLDVLKQLTKVGDVSEELFASRFHAMKASPSTYYITVIEDLNKDLVIATATLVIEQKFIHECAVRGRIEDVVVNSDYRGKDLGKILILTLSALAEKLNCYKVTLECKDSLVGFYGACGFKKESDNSNYLQKRLC